MVVNIQASVSGSQLFSIGIKRLNLSIFANIMLALIVLSSITKKGEIVTNMAPVMPFRVILVIECKHNTWTNMIVKMTILRLLGSSDDKEKEKIGIARPEALRIRSTGRTDA